MRLLLLLLSSTAAFASSIKRDLKGFTLAGYSPLSSAVDVAALDLDQKEMEKQMALGEFANAKNVYSGGGHSMRAAWLILKNLSGAAHLKKGAKVTGPRKINQFTPEDAPSEINGFLAEDYSWDDKKLLTHIEVFYDADAPPTTCMVGDMFAFSGATLEGCFNDQGVIQITNPGEEVLSFDYAYDENIREDNYSVLTLKRLSTEAGEKMKACPNCDYFPFFQKYVTAYAESDFADVFVESAFDKVSTNFDSNQYNIDFSSNNFNKVGRAEAIEIGTVYLSVLMASMREMEIAVASCRGDCKVGVDLCGLSPVHAWDKAAGFYVGSSQKSAAEGVFPYGLAEKICVDFKTCGIIGNSADPTDKAYVNKVIMDEFQNGQDALAGNRCDEAESAKNEIMRQMQIPIIQSFLRNVYMRKYGQSADEMRDIALVASYGAVVLPLVNSCSVQDALSLYDHVQFDTKKEDLDFEAVKLLLEGSYDCLRVSCDEVGGIWDGEKYVDFAAPCTFNPNLAAPPAGNTQSNSSSGPGMIVPLVMVISLGGILAYFLVRRRRKRSSRPQVRTIAAVAEIA